MEKLRNDEDMPRVMSLQLLSEITNNFSEERKIGSGTYGKVYKGEQNGVEIAVKMLHLTPGYDDLEQFKKEFENLVRLNHPNIVQLFGYCYEVKYEYVDPGNGRRIFAQNIYRALCFEYMHNGSLQKHLYDAHHGLDWQARYRIIKGICKGLQYLHEGLENPMYHMDLKPDNILLDRNMVPKLADFGLSKLVLKDQTHATQSSIGTMGYLPPEYIEQNLISKKLDIFSLGVVMIRIMTGYEGYYKKAEMSSQEFIELVQKEWRERLQAIPGCISLDNECHQVKRCIEIALDCVKADRKERPEIGTIIHWLNETDHMNENIGAGSLQNLRHEVVSHTDKERNFVVSDLVDELLSMDLTASPSHPHEISINVMKGAFVYDAEHQQFTVKLNVPMHQEDSDIGTSHPSSPPRAAKGKGQSRDNPSSSIKKFFNMLLGLCKTQHDIQIAQHHERQERKKLTRRVKEIHTHLKIQPPCSPPCPDSPESQVETFEDRMARY